MRRQSFDHFIAWRAAGVVWYGRAHEQLRLRCRSACRAGRGSLRDGCALAVPDSVVTLLARERGFAAGGRVVEIERLEFVVPWRRNREVGIGPAVRRRPHFVEDGLALPIYRPVTPHLYDALPEIARIE